MNFVKLSSLGFFALLFFGCQKTVQKQQQQQDSTVPSILSKAESKSLVTTYSCVDYPLSLSIDKTTMPGKTIFLWTITNPANGNGDNGTLQNLSHWDFVPSQCLVDNWKDVIEASYTEGTTWTQFSPTIEPDKSMDNDGCTTGNVFKFNKGTNGSSPTQYKLVLNGNWGTDDLNVYFKSGRKTGCCNKVFTNLGVGCKEVVCSYSQGYWFANNDAHSQGVHPWPGTVTIGGQTYTNAEGLAIWNTSNQGGIKDAKQAFTQLAALRLSNASDPSLEAAIATIENWLATKGTLTPANLPNQTAEEKSSFGDVKAAANTISQWIEAHHCD